MRLATGLRIHPAAPEENDRLKYSSFVKAVAESVVTLELDCAQPKQFEGSVSAVTRDEIHLLTIAGTPHAVSRTPDGIRHFPQHFYKFTVVTNGSGVLMQAGRTAVLSPGTMAIYDTDAPYTVHFSSDAQVSIVMFPKSIFRIPERVVRSVLGTSIPGERGLAAIAAPFVAALTRYAEQTDPVSSRRIVRSAVEIIADVLDPLCREPGDRHLELRYAVMEYIDEHLADPDLNPARIAAAHFISLRQLYVAFEGQRTSVAGIIRARRLELCRDALADPGAACITTAAIGHAHGFSNPTNFSRAFRARFGVSPRLSTRQIFVDMTVPK